MLGRPIRSWLWTLNPPQILALQRGTTTTPVWVLFPIFCCCLTVSFFRGFSGSQIFFLMESSYLTPALTDCCILRNHKSRQRGIRTNECLMVDHHPPNPQLISVSFRGCKFCGLWQIGNDMYSPFGITHSSFTALTLFYVLAYPSSLPHPTLNHQRSTDGSIRTLSAHCTTATRKECEESYFPFLSFTFTPQYKLSWVFPRHCLLP